MKSRLYICNGLRAHTHVLIYIFFIISPPPLFPGKRISGHRIAIKCWTSRKLQWNCTFSISFLFLGPAKRAPFQRGFWKELQKVIGTTGWESRSKNEGEGKRCGLENALWGQVRMLLALLTWVCVQRACWCAVVLTSRIHSRFGLRKSQISQRKMSGPAFVKLDLKLNITWGMNLLWFLIRSTCAWADVGALTPCPSMTMQI